MPDITNNTLRKAVSNDKLKGEAKSVLLLNIVSFTYNLHFAGSNSNSGLPDVTASTGFGGFLPAKELKAAEKEIAVEDASTTKAMKSLEFKLKYRMFQKTIII